MLLSAVSDVSDYPAEAITHRGSDIVPFDVETHSFSVGAWDNVLRIVSIPRRPISPFYC